MKSAKQRVLDHLFPADKSRKLMNFHVFALDPEITEQEVWEELAATFDADARGELQSYSSFEEAMKNRPSSTSLTVPTRKGG